MNNVHLTRCGRVLLLLLSVGCNEVQPSSSLAGAPGSSPAQIREATSASNGVASVASSAASVSPSVEDAPIDTAPAQVLLDVWVKAQNQGDFATYKALYAAKMMGIKRVGSRNTSFNREGWLEDREAMFLRPISVTVDTPRFVATPNLVLVSFKQTWQSSTFKDVGDKQLVLVREGGRLLISREEMLSSDLGVRATGDLELGVGFSLIKSAAGRTFAVLGRETEVPFDQIVVEHPIYVSPTIALRPMAPALLPPKAKAALGQTFRLYGSDGSCEATATAAWVLSEGHTLDSPADAEGRPLTSPTAIATSIWRLGQGGGRFLVVELAPGCGDALVARLASLPAAHPWYAQPCGEGLVRRALSAFRGLPGYAKVQARWREQRYEGYWEGKRTPYGAEGMRYACYGDGTTQYIALSAMRFTCSHEDGNVWAIYKVQDRLVLLTDAEPQVPDFDAVLPALGLDVNGDGLPEFFDAQMYIGAQRGVYRLQGDVIAPFFGCRC